MASQGSSGPPEEVPQWQPIESMSVRFGSAPSALNGPLPASLFASPSATSSGLSVPSRPEAATRSDSNFSNNAHADPPSLGSSPLPASQAGFTQLAEAMSDLSSYSSQVDTSKMAGVQSRSNSTAGLPQSINREDTEVIQPLPLKKRKKASTNAPPTKKKDEDSSSDHEDFRSYSTLSNYYDCLEDEVTDNVPESSQEQPAPPPTLEESDFSENLHVDSDHAAMDVQEAEEAHENHQEPVDLHVEQHQAPAETPAAHDQSSTGSLPAASVEGFTSSIYFSPTQSIHEDDEYEDEDDDILAPMVTLSSARELPPDAPSREAVPEDSLMDVDVPQKQDDPQTSLPSPVATAQMEVDESESSESFEPNASSYTDEEPLAVLPKTRALPMSPNSVKRATSSVARPRKSSPNAYKPISSKGEGVSVSDKSPLQPFTLGPYRRMPGATKARLIDNDGEDDSSDSAPNEDPTPLKPSSSESNHESSDESEHQEQEEDEESQEEATPNTKKRPAVTDALDLLHNLDSSVDSEELIYAIPGISSFLHRPMRPIVHRPPPKAEPVSKILTPPAKQPKLAEAQLAPSPAPKAQPTPAVTHKPASAPAPAPAPSSDFLDAPPKRSAAKAAAAAVAAVVSPSRTVSPAPATVESPKKTPKKAATKPKTTSAMVVVDISSEDEEETGRRVTRNRGKKTVAANPPPMTRINSMLRSAKKELVDEEANYEPVPLPKAKKVTAAKKAAKKSKATAADSEDSDEPTPPPAKPVKRTKATAAPASESPESSDSSDSETPAPKVTKAAKAASHVSPPAHAKSTTSKAVHPATHSTTATEAPKTAAKRSAAPPKGKVTAAQRAKAGKLPVILSSGIPANSRKYLAFLTDELGGKQENSFTDQVSHLVVAVNNAGVPSRTLKLLEALIRGVHIVPIAWALDSLEQKKYLPAEDFPVEGADTSVNRGNLFKKTHILLYGTFDDEKHLKLAEIEHLLSLCGATHQHLKMTSARDTSAIYEKASNPIIICDSKIDQNKALSLSMATGASPRKQDWIFDSMQQGRLMDSAEYDMVEAAEDEDLETSLSF